jgi:hypothetical protein
LYDILRQSSPFTVAFFILNPAAAGKGSSAPRQEKTEPRDATQQIATHQEVYA